MTDQDTDTLARIAAMPDVIQRVVIAEAVKPPLNLDLGCGQNPRPGYEGVDLYGDKAMHKVDLFKFPWPFADESVDAIHCSHFLEHVPAKEVEERDLVTRSPDGYHAAHPIKPGFLGQDMLFAFMDECWRIMKPGAWMEILVPSGRSDRAFQDPTHRRFFMQATFLYFHAPWRKANGLDHYRVRCNFGDDNGGWPLLSHISPDEEGLRSQQAQAARFPHMWNVTVDWAARLKKLPLMTG